MAPPPIRRQAAAEDEEEEAEERATSPSKTSAKLATTAPVKKQWLCCRQPRPRNSLLSPSSPAYEVAGGEPEPEPLRRPSSMELDPASRLLAAQPIPMANRCG